jgi:DNA polymerase-3 subunit gamma/tau
VVEEPPPHVLFIFATTEPEKVIGTIRSRTHHYPFRLVPPAVLQDYLSLICEAEGVTVDKGVLPLVVRAGAGSVRDSMSVLDQLVAGSDVGGIGYEGAVALLGYTDATLLDDVVEAFAVGDAATVFRVVDRVIETGHEPRRFVEDLLERLRDLVVVAAVPDGAHAILRGLPEDQLERMRQQSAHFGAAALSRAADIVNTGLTELTGATSPRLQLELLCARVLLPGASGESGYGARLDRIERRLGATAPPSTVSTPAHSTAQTAPPVSAPSATGQNSPAGEFNGGNTGPRSSGGGHSPAGESGSRRRAPAAESSETDDSWPELSSPELASHLLRLGGCPRRAASGAARWPARRRPAPRHG